MSSTTNTVYTTSSLIALHPSEPSICIPRVFMNIKKERVLDVFADLFGHNAIERVDMIERKNDAGEEYKRAFVHFKSWPRTEQATEVRLKLLNGDHVKIMYEQPWFWLISASRVPRPEDATRRERNDSRPFIVIDEESAKSKDERRTPYQPRQQQQHCQDERRPRHQEQQRYDVRPPLPPRRDGGYYDERRERDCREPRQRYDDRRDNYYHQRSSHQQPRHHHHQERHEERSSYTRRLDSRRPPTLEVTREVTPKKSAPEIADWIAKSKKAPGAPVKKPRLVLADDEAGAGAGADEGDRTTDIKSRGRKLSFDEPSSSDDEAVQPTSDN